MTQKIFIGVSWPYASGNIHIGHLAGQYIVCDVFARYHRLKGNEVLMVSGSDSHGAPVVFKAEEEGITPAELAQKSHELIVDTYSQLGLLYENYTKTTTETHKEVAQNIFSVMRELGYLKVETSKQYYDPKVERFLPDRYVRGTCPNCGATNARGDECPECGEFLDPTDLIDPYSTLSDAKPELRDTDHYYMDLTALEGRLGEWIRANSDHWRKWVREFSLGWINQGLKPRAVTRDMQWGVPVPVDGWEGKVLYVWIEAVVGYFSAAIEWAVKRGTPEKWEDFWKNPECKHYYFIAGGNVPFHTIMWPGELIAYSEKYENDELWEKYKLPGETKHEKLNLPYDVPANNMLTRRGSKMSKGDKTGIGVAENLERFGPDLLRFFFTRYAPENSDREFIWKDLIDANNNELVANIGNFINRVLVFSSSKFEGVVPEGTFEAEVQEAISLAFNEVATHIENCEFVKSIEAVLKLGSFANKYFNDKAPWVSIKENPVEAANTLFNCFQLVNALRVLLKPYTPFAVKKLNKILNLNEVDPNDELRDSGEAKTLADFWNFSTLEAGLKFNEPEILFNKLEYTDELRDADTQTSDTDEEKFKHVILAEVIEKSLHPNGKHAIYQVTLGEKKALVVSHDTTLGVGDKAFYAGPGGIIPSEVKKGPRSQKLKVIDFDGVESQGMLLSEKELTISKKHEGVAKVKTSLSAGAKIPQDIKVEEILIY